MSLLLDALKKAADDKEKGAHSRSVPKPSVLATTKSVKKAATGGSESTAGSQTQSVPVIPETDDIATDESLTLDIEDDGINVQAKDDASQENGADKVVNLALIDNDTETASAPDDTVEHNNVRNNKQPVNEQSINEQQDDAYLSVSDSALSLLIDKTNNDEKKTRLLLTAGIFIVSLLILVAGGYYYYADMQAEIAAIERKHQIAMQRMRDKTRQEKPPEKTAIIRNLVSDAKLEQKVEYAKAKRASEKKPVAVKPARQSQIIDKPAPSVVTIKKTQKSDPVGDNLDAAWIAYGNGKYEQAKQHYAQVLNYEENNRDAQLGLAAIAVIQEDITRARRIYLSLLKQDPRDPVAIASLAGLSSDETSLKADNDYLLSLLEKNPEAPHLNFSIGNNFAKQKKWSSAQKYYFKAWQLDIENADYLFNLAVSMDQLGKPQQALGFYRDSLKKSSGKTVSFSAVAVQKRIDELSKVK